MCILFMNPNQGAIHSERVTDDEANCIKLNQHVTMREYINYQQVQKLPCKLILTAKYDPVAIQENGKKGVVKIRLLHYIINKLTPNKNRSKQYIYQSTLDIVSVLLVMTRCYSSPLI